MTAREASRACCRRSHLLRISRDEFLARSQPHHPQNLPQRALIQFIERFHNRRANVSGAQPVSVVTNQHQQVDLQATRDLLDRFLSGTDLVVGR